MPRGRKPTPPYLKILRGNPGCRRLPEGEPKHERAPAIPEPPVFLLPTAKAEWRRLATGLYHMGLLTLVDERPFAAYCQAFGRWVAAEDALQAMEAIRSVAPKPEKTAFEFRSDREHA